jgi:hypothetical protein
VRIETRILRPAERLLPIEVEQKIRRMCESNFSGRFQLNIKDGVIVGFHLEEIVVLRPSDRTK